MSNNVKQFCLVTGCSGGIGQALVDSFCQEGYQVIGIDKDQHHLIQSRFTICKLIYHVWSMMKVMVCSFVQNRKYNEKLWSEGIDKQRCCPSF